MSRQHVEFKVPGTDKDSGEEDLTAIKPVADGEPGQAAVFKRPSENLRTRTEFIRDELENLKYLSDADRALLLTSTGSITWNGLPTGTFSATADMTLKPFLAPHASTAARLIICAGTQAQITIRTRQNGVAGQPRAYSGANAISIDFTPVTTGTGAIVVTSDGTPNNNVHVQYDDNALSGTTVDQIPANSFIQQFNASAVAISLGLEAVVEGTGSPLEVGFPTPPPVVAASLIKDYISVPEQATRFMSGAADAEKHNITPAHLTTFFSDPLNVLLEGDVVCLRYDELVMVGDGGRRQSIDEFPENKADVAGLNLFILRRFPDRLPGALPVAAVVNGTLIFVNGRSFLSGETGPLVAAGASYQGSPAAPNSWADGTVVAGPVSFESALDTVIQTLGTKSGGTPGAIKVGFTPSGNIAANTVKGALEELDSEKAGLALVNTFTRTNSFLPTTAGDAITVTANSGHGARIKGSAGNLAIYAEADIGGSGISAYGDGGGHGVLGEGGATNGTGVHGQGGGTSGIGVLGEGTGISGAGVEGQSAAVADAAGVVGRAMGEGSVGVRGLVNGSVLNGTGITGSGKGTGTGIIGQTTSSYYTTPPGGIGVLGAGGGAGASGVRGVLDTSGTAGVHGIAGDDGLGGGAWSGAGGPFGVIGVAGDVGAGYGYGVVGIASSEAQGVGVVGLGDRATVMPNFPSIVGAVNTGVAGKGADGSAGSGVYGKGGDAGGTGGYFDGSGSGVGVLGTGGTSANTHGVVGHTQAPSGGRGVYGYGDNNSVATGVYGQGANGTVGNTNGGVGVLGKGGLPSGSGLPGPGVQAWASTPSTLALEVIGANNWDLTTMEGDVRIGDTVNRIKMGIAVSGGGAGDASIASQGGMNRLSLGAGTTTAQQKSIIMTGGRVGIGNLSPTTEALEVNGNVSVPAANNYKYATARTRHSHAALWETWREAGVWTDNFQGNSLSHGYIQKNTFGLAIIIGRVHLPAGALVTSMDICYTSSEAGATSANIYLGELTYEPTPGFGYTSFNFRHQGTPFTLNAGTASPTWANVSSLTNTSTMTALQEDSLGVRWTFQMGGTVTSATSIRLYGVRINYTQTIVDHNS